VLLAFRFLTGLGLGGEFAPGTTMVVELWNAARRGRAAGVLSSAFGVGCLLASGLWLLVGDLGHGAWRVMFLIGVLPALLLLLLRRSVEDLGYGGRRIASGVPHARRPGRAGPSTRTNGV
jgi:MFS family permease